MLVGGTGLYFETLLHGIAPVPDIDPDIRAAVRAMPVTESHAALVREDPDAATRLNAADTTRVARALEVIRSTGRTLAMQLVNFLRAVDGKIIEFREFSDTFDVVEQAVGAPLIVPAIAV